MKTSATSPDQPTAAIFLSAVLDQSVVDTKGIPLGKLADIIVRLRGNDYPVLTALVVGVGSERVFVPATDVEIIGGGAIKLATSRLDVRAFQRRPGEVLLRDDVLGHRLIDVERVEFVRAHDIRLSPAADGWVVTALDVRKPHWWGGRTDHTRNPPRDWRSFEALIGHEPSLLIRSSFGRLRGLKPAEIADLIETASSTEQTELLAQVHTDPELESDVFEELDDHSQAQLFSGQSAEDVVNVLSRMRADDAADAIADLPQNRRATILAALPETQRTKVLTLLGYHTATAGGLMGLEFLALPEQRTIGDALDVLRAAIGQQPEALTAIYTLDDGGALSGSLSLVLALQHDPHTILKDAASPSPVHAGPQDDIIEITTRMADFNLLTLPVIDEHGHILGVITVDDVLEAAIPDHWRRRNK